MKISVTKKVVAGVGAATLAVLGVLAGVQGAAPASADTTSTTLLRNGGQYGDGRENLCLDVVDADLSLTTRPCAPDQARQIWKITYVSYTTAWIENTYYHKCIGYVGGGGYKKPGLTQCGFSTTRRIFTTSQYQTGWLSIHTPDEFYEDRSWMFSAATDKVNLLSEYYAGSPAGANPLARWQQVAPYVYYPPPKGNGGCNGFRCPDPE